jgi:hypothetical protein
MTAPLTRRALNRALLARQMLLARESVPALPVIERLVGLQAQQARPPFVGLWSRIDGFQREELLRLIREREVVRATMMRGTLHLMSRRDYLAFRPAIQPVLDTALRGFVGAAWETFPLEGVVAESRRLFSGPLTFTDVRTALLELFPNAEDRSMGLAARCRIPLAITDDPGHAWGYRADAPFTLAENWLGEPVATTASLHELVLRYLAAFGPATVADAQAWSGLQGLAATFADLRPQLLTFRDERGRALFDLTEAPRPPEDTRAPARFIADFDNLILSHADRNRVIADEQRKAVITKNGQVLPTVLVDGFVAGIWRVTRKKAAAALNVTQFAEIPKAAKEELAEEAESLTRFLEPEATYHELHFQ